MARRVCGVVWQERRDVLSRFSSSGLSLAEFARREGIAYGRLIAWRQRFRRDAESRAQSRPSPSPSPLFREVTLGGEEEAAPSAKAAPLEVVLPGGVVVRVSRGADEVLLRTVLRAVMPCS